MGLLGISTACRLTLQKSPIDLNSSPQSQNSVSSPAAKRYGFRAISTGQEQVFHHPCARRYAIADNEIGFNKRLIITSLRIILVPFCTVICALSSLSSSRSSPSWFSYCPFGA